VNDDKTVSKKKGLKRMLHGMTRPRGFVRKTVTLANRLPLYRSSRRVAFLAWLVGSAILEGIERIGLACLSSSSDGKMELVHSFAMRIT
jgi:hypothetical protein